MNRVVKKSRKAVAFTLILTVGSFYTLLTSSAAAQTAAKLSGDLSAKGAVTLNGVSAVSGATVLDGGRVKTGRGASAVVSLGRMGQVELGAESELVLKLEEGRVGGQLRAGRAVVSAPAGVGVSVETADGVASAEGKAATVLRVDVSCGNTRVASSRSDARVTAGNKVEYVAAGQEVAVGQAAAGQNSRCTRLANPAAAGAAGATGLGAGALAALIIAGVGGAVAAIVAAQQSDETSPTSVNVSTFRP
jgi:hypothetical protein